jgi:hypothetical protein
LCQFPGCRQDEFLGVDSLSVRKIINDRQIQSSAMSLTFIPAVAADLDFFIQVHHIAYRSAIESMFGWDERRQEIMPKLLLRSVA